MKNYYIKFNQINGKMDKNFRRKKVILKLFFSLKQTISI